MAGKFKVSTVFDAVDRFSAPLRRMTNRMNSFARNAEKKLDGITHKSNKMAASMKTFGATMLASTALVAGGLTKASAAGIDFEHTMITAAAKFGTEIRKGTKEFERLESTAAQVGATTEFTATQAAEALNFLAMAGFSAEESIAALPGVVDLATAANLDLATATDIASDALGAFSLASEDADQQAKNLARVNDVLATTANSANTNMVQLFESLKKGGPAATAAGASLETVSAMAGIMANAGIKGELAGTAIQNAFLNLSKPSTEATKVMQRLRIQTQDANGSLLPMADILDNVNKATASLTKTQRQAAIETIFGREGLAGMLSLISLGGDGLREFEERLEASAGKTSELAGIFRESTRNEIAGLRSAIEGVSIETFNMANGPFREAIRVTTEWVRANGTLIAQNLSETILSIANNIDGVITGLKLVIGLVAGVWALDKALKAVAVTMKLVNLVMRMNPIGLVITAVTALVGLALTLTDSWGAVGKFFEDLWGGIVATFKMGTEFITNAVDNVANAFGFGDDDETEEQTRARVVAAGPAGGFQMSSPQERVARSIEERRSTTEVTLRDETGRAEITGATGPQSGLKLLHTGAF